MEIQEKIIETLQSSDQPLKGGEIAEKADLDKKEVTKAIKNLVKDGKVFSPKRCFYAAK